MAHKNTAAKFHQRLRSPKEDECCFSMDCEKTQPLPKLAIGAAYFKRQTGMANFTVVAGNSKVSLNKSNCTSFIWPESEAKKGVNEIASGMYHVLKSYQFEPNQRKIVIAMDNTVSTNKSQGMIAMVMYYLAYHAPKTIKEVRLSYIFQI